jgi:FMN phosphatase YigB (HAD superfamily)
VRKPHPLIFERALSELSLDSKQVIMIGDSMGEDITGAKSVGIDAVLIDRTSTILRDDILCVSKLVDIHAGQNYVN